MKTTAKKLLSVLLSVALLFYFGALPAVAETQTPGSSNEEVTDPEFGDDTTQGGENTEGGEGGDDTTGGDNTEGDDTEDDGPKEPTFPAQGVIFDLSSSTMNLRVRSGPGTSYARVTHNGVNVNLYNGDVITVLEEMDCDDSTTTYAKWYKAKMTFNGAEVEGYVPTDFVQIKEQVGEITQDFEEMIADFPEDYKPALRELHLYYPNWKFVPLKIDMDWSYVIDREVEPDTNNVNSAAPESWRSTLPGSYDWTTDTWVMRGAKYDASREIISHYMDPRNFLDEKYIFQFESLSYDPEVHTLTGVEAMISKINFMKGKTIKNADGGYISYAQAYMDAAEKSNVSPYHLVARTRQEVGVNGSGSVTGNVSGYEGIYNFYNIQATGTLQDGLRWASQSGSWGRPWNTQYKSIVNGADWIGDGYINKGQNTLYFEKFAVVGNGLFWHQYMGTLTAPYNEASTIYNAYQEMGMLSSALSFIIPVYKNMPEQPCEKPTWTGSPNNWLKTLEVEGHSITPSFECNGSTEYSLIVENNVTSITVKATAVSDQAVIADGSTRTVNLAEGTNTVNIKVTAGNGDIKTYVLTVVREESPDGGEDPDDPPEGGGDDPAQGGYNIDYTVQNGKVSGIALGTTLETVKSKLGLSGGATAAFFKSDGSAITDLTSIVATGMTIKITANGTTDIFTILIYGDANGDGVINAIDLLMVRRHILGTYTLKTVYYNAGDTNKDGEINAVDLLMVRRHILETYTIVQ